VEALLISWKQELLVSPLGPPMPQPWLACAVAPLEQPFASDAPRRRSSSRSPRMRRATGTAARLAWV